LLLGVALGVTAASHSAAAIIGLVFAAGFLLYLAPGKRLAAMIILAISCVIAQLLLWASYSFNGDAMSFWFQGRAAVLELSWHPFWRYVSNLANAGVVVSLAIALAALASFRRCRYFGNFAPLIMSALLLLLRAADGKSAPWLWALPFLFAFIGGVFADLLETRQRKQFTVVVSLLLAANAILCFMALPALAHGITWTP
jgi:hypothetical protein